MFRERRSFENVMKLLSESEPFNFPWALNRAPPISWFTNVLFSFWIMRNSPSCTSQYICNWIENYFHKIREYFWIPFLQLLHWNISLLNVNAKFFWFFSNSWKKLFSTLSVGVDDNFRGPKSLELTVQNIIILQRGETCLMIIVWLFASWFNGPNFPDTLTNVILMWKKPNTGRIFKCRWCRSTRKSYYKSNITYFFVWIHKICRKKSHETSLLLENKFENYLSIQWDIFLSCCKLIFSFYTGQCSAPLSCPELFLYFFLFFTHSTLVIMLLPPWGHFMRP